MTPPSNSELINEFLKDTSEDIHHTIEPVEKPIDPYKNIAILKRPGSDVIIREHAIAYGYVIISQTIDNDTDHILINSNEVEDLIDVLQRFKEMVALSKIGV